MHGAGRHRLGSRFTVSSLLWAWLYSKQLEFSDTLLACARIDLLLLLSPSVVALPRDGSVLPVHIPRPVSPPYYLSAPASCLCVFSVPFNLNSSRFLPHCSLSIISPLQLEDQGMLTFFDTLLPPPPTFLSGLFYYFPCTLLRFLRAVMFYVILLAQSGSFSLTDNIRISITPHSVQSWQEEIWSRPQQRG